MTNNKALEAGLKAMAEDFHLPGGGRKKLSRLVAGHLWWFDAAELRGMSWRDMISALTAAGVTGRGGQPVSVGTLSSTVWRVRAEKDAEVDNRPRQESSEPEPVRGKPPPRKANLHPAAPLLKGKRTQPQQVARDGLAGRATSTSSTRAADGDRANCGNKDVLAFMDRARTVRRRSEI